MEEQDGVVTTGGPLSWIDLAPHVIRRLAGPETAKLEADPLLMKAEQIVRHANPGLTATELALALNLSERIDASSASPPNRPRSSSSMSE